jgi:hypothetical protein
LQALFDSALQTWPEFRDLVSLGWLKCFSLVAKAFDVPPVF